VEEGLKKRAHRLPWKRDFATGEIIENAQVSFGNSNTPSHTIRPCNDVVRADASSVR
jgi:hypothetical protein